MNESRESAEGQADHICKRENPDGMALDELRALRKRAEVVLSELYKLLARRGHMSSPRRSSVTLKLCSLEQQIARINDLIQAHLSAMAYVDAMAQPEECDNLPAKFKI